ncbi:hypothetical protein ACGFXC_30095 [Streptomyces sp. NPDC048507]|uniref:hypothetical protein n=1 Tax=Streptomyces sp. NPDC048507 TaxID=3365560 RepID=UPI0037122B20
MPAPAHCAATPSRAVWRSDRNGLLERLGEHCQEAHCYEHDGYDDAHGWAIAEGGRVIRSYGTYREPQGTGEPLPWEEPQTEDPLWEPGVYAPNASCECNANGVAVR